MDFPDKKKVISDGYFFGKNDCKNLKYYVYADYDSKDNGIPFYIGKGKGIRCFEHLYSKSGSGLKVEKLRKIFLRDEYPTIEILRYGMDENQALIAEAIAIELIGKDNLTNIQNGHDSGKFGRHGIDNIKELLSDEKAIKLSDLPKNSILIKINRSYKEEMSLQEIYDATRSCWKINPKKRKRIEYVFSLYNGIIKQVFIPVEWIPGYSTLRYNTTNEEEQIPVSDRVEFVGRVAHNMQHFIGKRVITNSNAQNPCCYTESSDYLINVHLHKAPFSSSIHHFYIS